MCNTFRKKLGERIREIRKRNKITQEQLSLESNISRSHIAMIEAGRRDITVSALFKISRALNADFKEIFDFDDISFYTFDIENIYK